MAQAKEWGLLDDKIDLSRNCFSYSNNCPIKLKLGLIDGLFDFTNL